jgi:vancomycin resistance protein VanJ
VASESFWAGTLLLFSPRWLFALPLLALVPLAVWKRRSALLPLGVGALIWLVPFSGFSVNWPSTENADRSAHALRIMTCNMQGGGIDYVAFNAYLQQTQPDLVLLQEWTDGHRSATFRDEEWQLVESGGLWAASRRPIRGLDGMPRGQLTLSAGAGAYRIEAAGGAVAVANIHLPTPRDGISSVIHRRLRGISALKANTSARRVEYGR